LVAVEKDNFPVTKMCIWLNVSRAGFYEWRNRPMSERKKVRNTTTSLIAHIFADNRGVFGHRRIHAILKNSGYRVGLGQVGAVMRQQGLIAKQCKAYKRTTVSDPSAVAPADLIRRVFTATAPGEKLVGDITYIKTGEGWLYLSTVIDLFSRKVVGWSMKDHMKTDFICDSLTMAKTRGYIRNNAIFHSGRGSQYTSAQFAKYCDDPFQKRKKNNIRIRRSTGQKGTCYDNAVAESFFATLKNELVHHETYTTRKEAKTSIAEYIEIFYNRQRPHSSNNYKTPQHKENKYRKTLKKTIKPLPGKLNTPHPFPGVGVGRCLRWVGCLRFP
jgi:putative transposase